MRKAAGCVLLAILCLLGASYLPRILQEAQTDREQQNLISGYIQNPDTTDEENTEDDSLINGHRYVDLGLSVMWADCNIGSDNPYNHGMLCGWADITGGKGSEEINDYPSANPPLNICGNSSYDIAYSKWGKE